MTTALTKKFADKFSLKEDEITNILKSTCFKGDKAISDAQMSALLIVSDQYGLNPFTKEIYAFPDQNNGIVPVVGIDGWARIINEHPSFDGMEFIEGDGEHLPEWIECAIYRKDRSHPIRVKEYMAECKRSARPWQSHPRRMLRHKAMIQCARLAFGYVGIYDQDEADNIIKSEIDMGNADIVFNIQPLLVCVNNAKTEEELTKVWQLGIKEINASADLKAREIFKGAVAEKGKRIKEQPKESVDNLVDDFIKEMGPIDDSNQL